MGPLWSDHRPIFLENGTVQAHNMTRVSVWVTFKTLSIFKKLTGGPDLDILEYTSNCGSRLDVKKSLAGLAG